MKLSIITVNLNNLAGLKKTMQSVFEQTFTDYEYIIIDGGSTDGSKEYIEQHADRLAYWVSEKDGGVYEAMNKGIGIAKGEYLIFMNSGDYLINKESINNLVDIKEKKDVIYGDIFFEMENSKVKYTFPEELTFGYFIENFNSLPHCATLIKKSLFEIVGNYSENFRIVSDWEFFLLALNKYNCSYIHVPKAISVYNYEGISSDPKNRSMIRLERQAVLNKYFPTFIDDYSKFGSVQRELNKISNSFCYKIRNKLFSLIKKNR